MANGYVCLKHGGMCPPGYVMIFPPYIVRNGKVIYPKRAKRFAFCVPANGRPGRGRQAP